MAFKDIRQALISKIESTYVKETSMLSVSTDASRILLSRNSYSNNVEEAQGSRERKTWNLSNLQWNFRWKPRNCITYGKKAYAMSNVFHKMVPELWGPTLVQQKRTIETCCLNSFHWQGDPAQRDMRGPRYTDNRLRSRIRLQYYTNGSSITFISLPTPPMV